MTYLFYVKLYLLTVPVFFLIDIVWLGWLGREFYRKQIGFILSDRVNWWAAGAFYLVYIGGILIVAVVFAPLEYAVDDVGVLVKRIGPRIRILHHEIAAIRALSRREMGFSLRLCGSGGFFGFFGRFWSARLGKHRAYCTNMRDLVLIECRDGRKFVLSPHPAGAFVEAVTNACG